jgi:poly(3-hydroxybutyrate) depolymerase
MRWRGVSAAIRTLALCLVAPVGASAEKQELPLIEVPSTIDGTMQPCVFIPAQGDEPRPLLVFLHPWSHGCNTFKSDDWHAEAKAHNWYFLGPHFRGPNKRPEACASPEARQDILDAVAYVCAQYAVDETRVYLAGASGGGHMAMVMAAHAPKRWTAVSAWCGISDLAAWHAESKAAGRHYHEDVAAVVGGAPGSSPEVDEQLRYRSPVHHMAKARDLPVDLSTGIHDGHTGSVPIHHTIDAFNVIAQARRDAPVSPEETATLSEEKPLETQEEQDATYGGAIYLRRYSGPSRVTIFEGGHEGLPKPAFAWLKKQSRTTRP